MIGRYANGNRFERVMADLANVGIVVIALAVFAALAVTIWPFDPVTRLAINTVGPIHAGQPIRVKVDYCKDWNAAPVDVKWVLVDGVTIVLPSTMVVLPTGCYVRHIIIPTSPHMTPGRYQLEVSATYSYLWRTIPESGITPVFEVLP